MELSLLPMESAPSTPTEPMSPELPKSTESAAFAVPPTTQVVADRPPDPAVPEAPPVAEVADALPATAADRYLAAATREYECGKIDPPLWDRAVELAGGDHAAAVPGYLRARATALRLAGRGRTRSAAGNPRHGATIEPAADPATGDAKGAAATSRRRRSSRPRGWLVAAIGAGAAGAVAAAWFLAAPRDDAGASVSASPAAPVAARAAQSPAPAAPQVDAAAEREAKVQELLRAGNWNVLVLHAAEWTRKEPENARAWKHLGVGYANLKQIEDALAASEKAAQLAPADREAWKALGRLGVAAGRPEAALRAYERAVELDPQDASSLVQVGRLQAELGRPAQAKVSLDRALAIAGNDPDALCAQAQLALAQGKGKESETIVRELRRVGSECSVAAATPAVAAPAASTTAYRPASPRDR